MRSFEDLDCWKKASSLRRKVSLLSKTFPKEEKYRLTDQMVRASRSVTANIAEGFGRFHYQEYIQYCRQARGSLYEILDHLTVAFEEQYISELELNDFKIEINGCLALLNGFINYLTKVKNQNTVNDPESTYNLTEAISE